MSFKKGFILLLVAGYGITALYFGSKDLVKSISIGFSGISDIGVLEKYDRRSSGRYRRNTPVVSFQTRSNEKIFLEDIRSERYKSFEVGDKVSIIYLPGAPEQAMVDTMYFRWYGPAIEVLVGLLCLTILIGPAIYQIHRKNELDKLEIKGTRITAVVKEFLRLSSKKKPSRWLVYATWTDERGKSHELLSDELSYDPGVVVSVGQKIEALVLKEKPKVHKIFIPSPDNLNQRKT